ncbi:Chorismate synthase (5-enolpyruvylshikimate-3-phosphate phospholyase) [Candidatus Methylomirabilis oxygeniifera]|uniref:Chorismate synthase n=1 Tax=Methylomirabilis oxygeniifera TaxID=671143 RepID=D5MFD3_METO1|nr:Chorismate synthase (5-enolpyruvylshikimate-3-phosphate phospholyase) [Candidatus Methylomirabilis oxyfera]
MLRYLTAGETHGPMLTTILEGIPANLPIAAGEITCELVRRQQGYGRGGRMRIEKDEANIVGGVRHGLTLGSPIAILIANRDWDNWKLTMDPTPAGRETDPKEPVTRPRPGHADLAGALKYGHQDIRNVLERASARETAARMAVGAVCKRLLLQFGVEVFSHVLAIGGIEAKTDGLSFAEIRERAELSPVRCADQHAGDAMMRKIDEAKSRGTSLGGVFEVVALNPPVGLGSYVQWDDKLDGRLAQAVMSIQAIKGVEIGLGFEGARRFGYETHDEIFYEDGCFMRRTNRAGGLEGGMSNGEPIVVRGAMKPIATQYAPMASVDLRTKEPFQASVERSDICAVPAAGVVGEAVVAFEIARAFREKFGGDSLEEMTRNYQAYVAAIRDR